MIHGTLDMMGYEKKAIQQSVYNLLYTCRLMDIAIE